MLWIIAGFCATFCGMMAYGLYNANKKIELYEATIESFYTSTATVLHTMRSIDERQMFESDDEVGSIFDQLVDILGLLRPILYGVPNDEEEDTDESTIEEI